MIFLKLR
jgi:ABC-type lipoprotein release transport system permease subunit